MKLITPSDEKFENLLKTTKTTKEIKIDLSKERDHITSQLFWGPKK